MDLQWLKTLATLCWAASPIVDRLHDRKRGPWHQFCSGLRYFSGMSQSQDVLSLREEYGKVDDSIELPAHVQAGGIDCIRGVCEKKELTPMWLRESERTWIPNVVMAWCGVRAIRQA